MTTPSDARHVAVIGGGISGLAAANRLRELHPNAKITLLEAKDRLGGVLQSERRDGFLIEHAADNFITTPPWATTLCDRIGFADQLIQTNDAHRRAFVVRKSKLQPIPAGFAVMAPSRIWPIVSTPLLSPWGKMRMIGEVFVRAQQADPQESLAGFVRRRFGREVYERLVQPLIAGIYTGDPNKLSLAATLPRFLEMEKEQGSLVRAMWKQRKQKANAKSSGARYSQFVAPRDGMVSLVQAFADRLVDDAAKPTEICLSTPVNNLQATEQGQWKISLGQDQTLLVDGVVLATPARHCSALLQQVDQALASEFAAIGYGNCALVSLGFAREQIGHPLDGFGFVVPLIEGRQILSCSFTSIKYQGRAPEGQVLLRAFVGGACQSELVELDDQALRDLVMKELASLLAIRGKPTFTHIVRQREAMPQYYVGHELRVQRIEAHAAKLHNLALAGNALSGIGIPNCMRTGEQAAESLVL